MQGILLTSILIATIVIPLLAARDVHPRRGLVRAVIGLLVFDALYLVACLFVYPRIL